MARVARGTGLRIEDCLNLKQWRDEHLMCKQIDIADRLRRRNRAFQTNQGTVSRVENGELPESWTLIDWAAVYELAVRDFVRLVKNAAAAVPIDIQEQLHTKLQSPRWFRRAAEVMNGLHP